MKEFHYPLWFNTLRSVLVLLCCLIAAVGLTIAADQSAFQPLLRITIAVSAFIFALAAVMTEHTFARSIILFERDVFLIYPSRSRRVPMDLLIDLTPGLFGTIVRFRDEKSRRRSFRVFVPIIEYQRFQNLLLHVVSAGHRKKKKS